MADRVTGHVWLEALYCTSASFRQQFVPEEEHPPAFNSLDMDIETKIHDPGEGPIIVELMVAISHDRDAGQPYDVKVAYAGRFGLGDLPDRLTREVFAKQNAVAIMFPFVRSAIAGFTMQGTTGPLLVPAVNVLRLIEENLQGPKEQEE